jgi:hypothetical protein
MEKFLKEHWFNISTLAIAIIAVWISLQSNRIALNASTPRVEVINDYRPFGSIIVTGCTNKSATPYELNLYVYDYFTVVNRGGLKTSLIRVDFSEGDRNYYDVSAYQLGEDKGTSGSGLAFPLDIEAGTGRIWEVDARNTLKFATIEEALNAINLPNPNMLKLPATKKPYLWKFEFSDGSTATIEQKEAYYNFQPNIDVHMENDICEP